ncbi:hypothetical protein A2774_05820 [Candidatus Roizmanbacteria bacterium RIFCSPHIGHO2_01_FULL_39_12c]|uniref:Uncharacterized protein n=1 Tax=Candidatus Roizmanbacteria bacterium RIFCSPHIGHO2_01_FULL_39_12c TaxID=1802031 RepID=A0A1F7GCP6_9BACT|nr:MAG: hypothetical protein A2774_05820 [Candidatus Roizmanbacteria bacterium RIFCSPHIGHO2_01_FULL_39_12c]OGK47767.1 MAG: hypothetical protein A2963_02830 [Candidatus Roizmanbacteria bacterium RIFCSPLOWO2_01_FULL_40_13]
MNRKGTSSLKAVLFLSLIIGSYLLFQNYHESLLKFLSNNQKKFSKFFDFQTPQTFYHAKYNYSIAYPKDFTLGFYNFVDGTFKEIKGFESRIGIYSYDQNPYKHFLEIQAIEGSDKAIKDIAQESFQKNTTHPQTTAFSPLVPIKIQTREGFEYTFTGQTLSSYNWSADVPNDKYKVVFTEKEGVILSIYFTDNDDLNQIFNNLVIN